MYSLRAGTGSVRGCPGRLEKAAQQQSLGTAQTPDCATSCLQRSAMQHAHPSTFSNRLTGKGRLTSRTSNGVEEKGQQVQLAAVVENPAAVKEKSVRKTSSLLPPSAFPPVIGLRHTPGISYLKTKGILSQQPACHPHNSSPDDSATSNRRASSRQLN